MADKQRKMAQFVTTPLQRLIDRYETKTTLVFKPSKLFYQTVGINRLRFPLLVRGQKNPDSQEIKALVQFFSQFFAVKADDLL